MADDTGDAFTRGRMALQVGFKRILAQIGTDLIVAAHAEVPVGAVGQLVDLVVERQINGRKLRVGVLGDPPFLVLLGVACAAGASRRVTAFGKQRFVCILSRRANRIGRSNFRSQIDVRRRPLPPSVVNSETG